MSDDNDPTAMRKAQVRIFALERKSSEARERGDRSEADRLFDEANDLRVRWGLVEQPPDDVS